MPYLIASDYHNTLAARVDGGYRVSREVEDAVIEYAKAGGLFAVVTSGTHRHVSLDRLRGFIIIAIENGLVVEMPGSGKALLEPPGWRRVREEVSAFLSSRGVPHYLGESSVFVDDARGVLEPMEGELRGLGVRVEWNRRSAALMPLGFDKGAAIRFLRGLLSPEAVVAVGDAENDIPMLREADVPVAVGNAEPAVKAVAKRVVREDGLGVIDVLNMVREWGKAF
ncbi:hypothetical protein GCM10007981_13340 [Thermocladium modestius]|uniref:Phosphoglycolate phosphatase n=1 Tax=Thermocladium modestius TaxID=62609 RepID=A0A830GW28_9CREN|nr:HAD family hydrolase [Thermocladium modestius]GGP21454.1 hypothetical protein GCM10007981_13340 [Thermocladium modestius]